MSNFIDQTTGFRIKTVSSITGLSTHVIRKWEERYDLLHPGREPNGYRIYSEEDIQLLLFVKAQLAKGESIGELSQDGIPDLQRFMQDSPISLSGIPVDYRKETLQIIQALPEKQIDVIQRILAKWIARTSLEKALDMILFPLLCLIGELWHEGRISISGEHAVTRLIRQHLVNALRTGSPPGQAHALLACVPGEYHEIAPLTAAFLLQNRGWQSTYLGSNVALEVLELALRRSPREPDDSFLYDRARPKDRQTVVRHRGEAVSTPLPGHGRGGRICGLCGPSDKVRYCASEADERSTEIGPQMLCIPLVRVQGIPGIYYSSS